MHLFPGPLLHLIGWKICYCTSIMLFFCHYGLCCSWIIGVLYDTSGSIWYLWHCSAKICLDIQGILCCCMNFRIVSVCLLMSLKIWWGFVEPIDGFQYCCHFHNISSACAWTWDVFASSKSLLQLLSVVSSSFHCRDLL